MRAFLIPHAAPHNSHELHPALSKARSRKSSEIIIGTGGQLLHIMQLVRRCFSGALRGGLKFATIKYNTRASPPVANYYFAKCERNASASERSQERSRRRNRVLAFAPQRIARVDIFFPPHGFSCVSRWRRVMSPASLSRPRFAFNWSTGGRVDEFRP